jgi:acyl-coenzyme A synthetase/AMP-(fatty) acid ligase
VLDPEPALALATSGVSGPPKVAERTWRSVLAGAAALAQAIDLDSEDVVVCTTPLHHAYSFAAGLLGCLSRGATYVAPPMPTTPAALAELSERHGVTVLFSVPVLYRWYLDSSPLPRAPRLAVSAGEPLAHELVSRWRETYARELCNHYGSTELGMLTFEPGGIPGSIGWPLAGIEVELRRCRVGGAGEMFVRTPGPPALLLDAERGVRSDVRAPSPFPTGDLARRERDGRLYVEGRVRETIDLGGVKVLPSQVEALVREHKQVRDCAVVSAADARGVPRMCAFVEARGELDVRELRSFMLTRTAAQKVPSAFFQLHEIPRTGSGKVDRRALVALTRANRLRARGA